MEKGIKLGEALGLSEAPVETGAEIAEKYLRQQQLEMASVVKVAISRAVKGELVGKPGLACRVCKAFADLLNLVLPVDEKGRQMDLSAVSWPKNTDLRQSVTVEFGDGTMEGSEPRTVALGSHLRHHLVLRCIRAAEGVLNAPLRAQFRLEKTALREVIFQQKGLDSAWKEAQFQRATKELADQLPWVKVQYADVKSAWLEENPQPKPVKRRPTAASRLSPEARARVEAAFAAIRDEKRG
jgi:hypothetical protein